MKEQLQGKRVVVLVALLAIAGTALAISVTNLAVEKISTASGRVAASDLSVTGIDSDVKGKNRLDLEITLTNGDTVAHRANMTVQVLDAVGDVVAEQTLATPSIAGGAAWSTSIVFNAAGLAADYAETFVILKQTA